MTESQTVQHLGQPWERTRRIDLTMVDDSAAAVRERAHLWAIRQYGPCDLDSVFITDLGLLAPCDVCGHQPTGRKYSVTADVLEPR